MPDADSAARPHPGARLASILTAALKRVRSWRRARVIAESPIADEPWLRVTSELDVLRRLDADELARLRELVRVFLHDKRFFGTHDLKIDDYVRIVVAAQACLLILNHDQADRPHVYPGWVSIILYPGAFVARHAYRDAIGVMHEQAMALEGETSKRGPMVISWEDARTPGTAHDGANNVVLHEFAHKLDYQDGVSNGVPVLHRDMSGHDWHAAFSAAFADLQHRIDRHRKPPINPYGATSPAEFFAVTTEAFFQAPARLQHAYPRVYEQLALYYRQDPLARDRASHHAHAGGGKSRKHAEGT